MPFDYTKEFVSLRSEILAALKEARSLERYVLVTVGAIWAFLAAHCITDQRPWAIPIALVVTASLRASFTMRHLGIMGDYIREKLEPKEGGYEAFLKGRRESSCWRHIQRAGSDYGPWTLLLSFSLAGLIWGPDVARSVVCK